MTETASPDCLNLPTNSDIGILSEIPQETDSVEIKEEIVRKTKVCITFRDF
jgi:hypothetical protein